MNCTKRRTDGQPCQRPAIKGRDACPKHVGEKLETAKAKGAVVVELRRWGLTDQPEDPGRLLLKLMTVSEWKRQDYEAEIHRILADTGMHLSEALIGDSIVVDKDGSPHKVGEYIRGIVQLEAAERDRAAGIAVKGIAAGLAERQVRLAERQGALVADVMRLVLADLGLDVADPRVMQVVSTRLEALAGATA